ncbi:uncharacterized protein TNCV_1628161 [Trichonephila clavipes]|nr:uncharacterized protein TNCV_1628161 [Trichonephila clavipes]
MNTFNLAKPINPRVQTAQIKTYFASKFVNSATKSKTNNLLLFLRHFLSWTGLLDPSHENIRFRLLAVISKMIFIFGTLDLLAVSCLSPTQIKELKTLFAYIIAYPLSLLSWHALYLKRRQFEILLQKFQDASLNLCRKRANSFAFTLLSTQVLFTILLTIYVIHENPNCYSYGYKISDEYARITFLGMKNFIYVLVYPTFTNSIVLLYGVLCLCLTADIRQLTEEIERCPAELFDASKQLGILKRKAKIDDILGFIEDIFSFPTFTIIIANLFIAASVIGIYLYTTEWYAYLISLYVERCIYFLNSLIYIIIPMWTAGGIPLEECKFREMFYKKLQSRMFSIGISEKPRLARWLFAKPEFVFTGWNILSYRRSTMFAVVGTLVTYTVLTYM